MSENSRFAPSGNTENFAFVEEVKKAIEVFTREGAKTPSKFFKPSMMKCPRSMFFVGMGYEQAPGEIRYNWTNSADTGSRRHEGIQETLLKMTKDARFSWEYVDVAKYVEEMQKNGKCKGLRIGEQKGAETHLYHDELNLSFFCDGILRNKNTGEYYLFEFKNKKSEKFVKSAGSFPMEHYDQCVIYCTVLDLEKVFLLMEDRNTLELACPELFVVTKEMKDAMIKKIKNVLSCMEKNKVPAKPALTDYELGCFFCPYQRYCVGS